MDNGIDYEALGVDRRQIRLVRLPPAPAADSPLDCALETFTRRTCPDYVALSYTWGSEASTRPITINDKACRVSPTVDQALREICRRGDVSYLWVDQICINQRDNEEKNEQVLQMRHIYSDAHSVIAWLGPSFDGCEALFKHLRRMGNGVKNRNWDALEMLHDDEEHLREVRRAYDALCRRSYWKRLWILQEFAIASDVSVMCGSAVLPYTLLLAVQESADRVSEEIGKRQTPGRDLLLERLFDNYASPSRSFMDSVITRRSRFRAQGYEGWEGDLFFQVLTTCLVLERDYNIPQTSDPRDRVFSLLYLAADVDEIKDIVDYSKTCAEVYRDTALALLNQGNVDVLAYSQFPKEIEGLPTWAPDWCMPVKNPCNQGPWSSKFSASGNSDEKQEVHEISRGRLSIKGFSVDTVKKYGNVWDPDWEEPLDRDAALAFIDDIKELCKQSPRVRANEELLDAVRVATSDGAQYGEEDVSGQLIANYIAEFIWAYDRLVLVNPIGEDGNPQEDQPPSDDDWLVRAIHYLHSRRPFLTSTGFVGLGPSHMEEGDEVCIFYGGKTPYMIRPEKDGEGYSLVGETFLYGVMHGEALKGEVNSKTYILQ
ncbi:unnamed protein product [Clonostachys byssicola]|uniref:Heterokaryon incompatibility domain-containing protein n=1 Tax=Clonostachys byssicola TaxID=160290 RepID=A0A9N9Y1S5_9HYPO|nr:unnamed protein product [Clonostachys byssicola]